MAAKSVRPDDLVKRREQFAKYRILQRKLEEERRRRRRREFIRSIKLFFLVAGAVIAAVAVFILFNGAWSIVDPIINRVG
jgi:fatty acid desaturase